MKVIVVCGAGTVYGREMIALSLMEGLRDRGHEIICITSTWGDGKFARLLDQLSISYKRLPVGFISKTISWSAIVMTLDQVRKLPALWRGYRKTVKDFRPDVVIHSNFHHLFVLWPVLGSAINVFHVHDYFSPTRFYKLVLHLLERRLSLFIGVSKFIAASLVALGLREEKIKYVLNGITVESSNGHRSRENMPTTVPEIGREGNGSFDKPVSIGIVGQVGEWKGHDDLIDALQILKSKDQSFRCRIYGDGHPEYVEGLKKKIDLYGLIDDVEWCGFVSSRRMIYQDIDVCVAPSRSAEPLGIVAAEASLFGIPTVATRRGGLPEVVLDNRTGFLVDAGSPGQLAEKLGVLLRSKQLRNEMGLAAKKYARQMLSSTRMVKEMETLLYSILKSNDPRQTSL